MCGGEGFRVNGGVGVVGGGSWGREAVEMGLET